MRRKILICLLVLGLGVGTATAQFGSGIVYDPTNFHNALLRYYQLQQHLVELQKSYAKLTSQLNLAMQMAQFIKNMPARYRALFSQWRNVTSLNTFGNTVSWINGINTGVLPNINTGYFKATNPLSRYSPGELSGMNPLELGRVQSQYASIELADGANMNAMATIGGIPQYCPRCPNPDWEPRTRLVLRGLESQQRSFRSEQNQCGRGLDPAQHPGFEQTPRLTFGTANHSRQATAGHDSQRH